MSACQRRRWNDYYIGTDSFLVRVVECVISSINLIYEEIDISFDEISNKFGSVLYLFNG